LCTITTLNELVAYLSQLGPLSIKVPPLGIPKDTVKLLYEVTEFFLLLIEGGLASEDAGLALALVLLLFGASLSPPPLTFHGGVAMKQALFDTSSASELAPIEPCLESSWSKSRTDVGW
jgi:hypothetical protein